MKKTLNSEEKARRQAWRDQAHAVSAKPRPHHLTRAQREALKAEKTK